MDPTELELEARAETTWRKPRPWDRTRVPNWTTAARGTKEPYCYDRKKGSVVTAPPPQLSQPPQSALRRSPRPQGTVAHRHRLRCGASPAQHNSTGGCRLSSEGHAQLDGPRTSSSSSFGEAQSIGNYSRPWYLQPSSAVMPMRHDRRHGPRLCKLENDGVPQVQWHAGLYI